MLRRIVKENQRLFIDSKEVLGIQDFSFNYNLPIDVTRYLGMENVIFSDSKPVTAEITVNKLLIDSDNFINYTGDSIFNGYLEYKDKYFAFNSGILNNYSISCAVNQIPTLNANLTVLGEFGEGVDKSLSLLPKNDITIADYGNIEVTLNDFEFNRLQNFTLTIDTNKNILYKLGNSYPFQAIANLPVITNLTFGIKVDDYQVKNIRDLLCQYKIESLSIRFKNFKNPNGSPILSFNFNEAIFLGESYEGSINDSSIVNLNYQVFNKPNLPITDRNNLQNEDTINLTNNISFDDDDTVIGYNNPILSDYTLVGKNGESTFYALVQKDENTKEYTINLPSDSGTDMIVRYDVSDQNPSFAYYNYIAPNYYLYYSKLTNETWNNILVGNIGPSTNNDSIDLQYDPNDNLPACISYDSINYDLNYYKYNGSSFVKSIISNGASSSNNIDYATLLFDPLDNYPLVHFIEGNSSILKSAKYNGSSWTITNINTIDPNINKRYAISKIDDLRNQPLIFMAGNPTGRYVNTRKTNNTWLSGRLTDVGQAVRNDIIYQKPQFEKILNEDDEWFISYIQHEDKLVLKKQYLNETVWSTIIDVYGDQYLNLISGANYIDKNKNISLKIDSDFQPIVFYKKNNNIKFIKGKNIPSQENLLKNLDQSSNYEFGVDFFQDVFKVYKITNGFFDEYKYPRVLSATLNTNAGVGDQYMTMNPLTNQPNFISVNVSTKIRFYYPFNAARTSWTGLVFPSGDINLSGTSERMTFASTAGVGFDKNTNQAVMAVLGYQFNNSNNFGTVLIKADPIPSSGYTYYYIPFKGPSFESDTDFKVNPITNKYCLVTAVDPNYSSSTSDTGVIYYEMDPITTVWTKTRVSSIDSKSSNGIHLDFKSDGNPILAYAAQSKDRTTGYLNISEYDGINWTTTTIDPVNNNNNQYYFTSFKYNSGENYYGIAYRSLSNNNSGFYITNRDGKIKKYNLGNQSNLSRVPHLSFKKYKNKVRPFIYFYATDGTQCFKYLETAIDLGADETFITGFKNNLGGPDFSKTMIVI
jgi:hypothetical protein